MTLEELTCKQECQDMVIRYFTILDLGPRSSIGDIFTEDGMLVRGDRILDPRQAFQQMGEDVVPIHFAINIVVDPTGPTTAEGTAYTVAYNMRGKPDDKLPRVMPPTPSRIGKMHFEFRKTPAGWRIYRQTGLHRFVDDGLT